MKVRRVSQVLDRKLPGERTRSGAELNRWLVIDGRKVLRVTFPKGHGGADLSPGVHKELRDSLRLNESCFREFIGCKKGRSDLERHLRALVSRGEL